MAACGPCMIPWTSLAGLSTACVSERMRSRGDLAQWTRSIFRVNRISLVGLPPLDEPPLLSKAQRACLADYVSSAPAEDSAYSSEVWTRVAEQGDCFITMVGCMYLAAHAYVAVWRATRNPTTLTPDGIEVFKGRLGPILVEYAMDVAKYGVKPMSAYLPVRSAQPPYSSVVDNPDRTCQDLREDLFKGRIMLFSKKCEHLVGPRVESRLVFVTQKDATQVGGIKVWYISDPRVEINERIEPKNHPMVRVPKHANVIRRIMYWKRRYPTIPVLLRKRDVEGAFKLSPASTRGLTHMGIQFSSYMVLYLSLYCGWGPSPASRGIISTLLLQFVSSFVPVRPRDMGPEGFVAYEYVGDGAFAEPWLDVRPWTSARIWEYRSQSCLGTRALHDKKRRVEGDCPTCIALWGLSVCAKSETISSPLDKWNRAQEFLADSRCDPGVTRIELHTLQELRGKADHWSLCNKALAPELHVIDRPLCSYRGLSRPHGNGRILKQVYFDFWDSMGIFRINMSGPEWWGATFSSSFNGVLTLTEKLSFNHERARAVWIGTDATLANCAAVGHANGVFTVFRVADYTDYLSDLTCFPRGDYELIAITELLSLICFLITRVGSMGNSIVR